ncbi:hypothetical protein UFOVP715_4 [uncultured Caudovirales phage]|uniref:Uncharacterized protein n=1 Tax=uncultured Caudovirales phage TaxID=2100421 RepID=A0A6J5NQZ9_9CAUD|nr:hypothetical protein UFOVP715_4 [uncultured Caudovirales phage]
MGRTVQTIAAPGAPTGGGLTSAQALALIRANTGYEYIQTVRLSASEVSGIQITGLDTSAYSAFRIVSARLGYGGSTTNVTWTLRVITGSGSVDSSSNYEFQTIKFSSASGGTGGGQTSWSTTFGFGGPPSSADFELDYQISPGSNIDANIRLMVGNSKPGGYWPSSGIMCGLHSTTGATPTGIEISSNQNFRAINDNAYVTVMGLRIKT